MNTSKQINIMVILIFLTLILLGAYTLLDPTREKQAQAQQTDVMAQRGAALFAQYCRPCHGNIGQGRVGPALNNPALRDPAILAQNQALVTDTISCGRVGTVMPTWGQSNGGPLSDQQILDLVTLITVDPNNAWNRYVAPDSAAANALATPPPAADLASGPATGSNASVCGQSIASTPPPQVAATPGTPATTLTETTTDNQFATTVFTVPAGQPITMTVTNKGQALHNWHVLNVKSDNGQDIKPGGNGLVASGQSATIKFTISKPGQYKFQCDVHPTQMIGTLFVVAANGAAPAATTVSGPATVAPVSNGIPNPATGKGIITPGPSGGTAGPASGSGFGRLPTRVVPSATAKP